MSTSVYSAGRRSALADQDQIANGGSIGNDDMRHDSEAKPVVSFLVAFQTLPGIFQPDLVLL